MLIGVLALFVRRVQQASPLAAQGSQ